MIYVLMDNYCPCFFIMLFLMVLWSLEHNLSPSADSKFYSENLSPIWGKYQIWIKCTLINICTLSSNNMYFLKEKKIGRKKEKLYNTSLCFGVKNDVLVHFFINSMYEKYTFTCLKKLHFLSIIKKFYIYWILFYLFVRFLISIG